MGTYSKLDESKIESMDAGVNAQNRYSQASTFSAASDATITPSPFDTYGDKLGNHQHTPPTIPSPSAVAFNTSTPHTDYQPYNPAGSAQASPRLPISENGTTPGQFVDPYARYDRP